MFIDEALLHVKAGKGGNGIVAFRREKFVPQGGPAGGNGGRGGDVILEVDTNKNTLLDFQHRQLHQAGNGKNGGSSNKQGADGASLTLKVPPGTLVYDAESGDLLADLTGQPEHERCVVARGGRGGRGNAAFATARNQAPRFAENGEPGEERRLRLQLKLLADVGLVGFPNVGKSTLISRVSAARPKIADYPFTTLVPNLGVVRLDSWQSFVMADIPGLVEGAHEGAGLGHQFLRHVERTRVLIHLLDVSGMTGRDPVADYHTINRELAAYSPRLASLPQLVALNKVDLPGATEVAAAAREALAAEGRPVFAISAVTGEGVPALISAAAQALAQARAEAAAAEPEEAEIPVVRPGRPARAQPWSVERLGPESFVVRGKGVERLVAMTNLQHEESVRSLQRKLERMGVFDRLRAAGAQDGNTVRVGDLEFDFIEEEEHYRRLERMAMGRRARRQERETEGEP
ncbi:MAG: GTPase ObgE [Armatimonadetes bacterium]|jgi:GTP-binding protein|nr:GTPase ObgE [Armatimonadota bacterium]